ncbi:phospholipase A1 VesT1.02-like [Hylaeus volcanicus]|uniref:phospholipase A1 VesT1.02-like n=1 Tax=Hylaeus volcanicus TaxID=313075 RepID=UPI0023B7E8A0|nr:phospholipase A1 VesT1.02-like [Hylaeus volcanicus]
MKTQVLASLLLFCGASGFALYPTLNENMDTAVDMASLFANPQTYLSIYDDFGNIVKIDMNLDDPETLEETKKDLRKRVSFYLYTKATPNNPEKLYVDDVNTLKKSHFNPQKQTVIITHGWMNSYKSQACTKIRDAYLQKGDYNIITVDWATISVRPYVWCSRRVMMIGEYVGKFINFLEKHKMNVSELTIVGHSLGAHIAGLSSYYSKTKAKYIVGLDPALPNFYLAEKGARISQGDGKYVMIIHTNGDLLGFSKSLGDIDFYPNGGKFQIGCAVDVGGACSHMRAVHYFAESINSQKGFWGLQCSDYNSFQQGICKKQSTALMGGHEPDVTAKGLHYLRTSKEAPFALGRL